MSHTKHYAKLIEQLLDGESEVAAVDGTITTTPTSASGTVRGTLVLTDHRFLFQGAALGSKESRTFPLENITSIDLHKNLMLAYIQVSLAGANERFLVKYREAEPFVEIAHRVLAEHHNKQTAPVVVASAADEIAKFAALHAQGILTDEEFAAKKASLLGI